MEHRGGCGPRPRNRDADQAHHQHHQPAIQALPPEGPHSSWTGGPVEERESWRRLAFRVCAEFAGYPARATVDRLWIKSWITARILWNPCGHRRNSR
jgi:hypothetical protein